jgi:predicted DNA-binding transcriptional regulator YafY
VLARLHTGVTEETLRWIIWHGPDCRVLAPESLRQQVEAMAEKTAAQYTTAPR